MSKMNNSGKSAQPARAGVESSLKMLMYSRVHCAFSAAFALSRARLSLFPKVIPILFVSSVAMAELPEDDAHIHMGVATCASSQCHGSAVPRDGSNVLQNEYVTWTQSDPHSRAYDMLSNELSLAMARRLGLESASTAAICLDCHADNVPAARRGEKFQISDGVGCEACHGGAEKWLSTHDNAPTVGHADNIAAGLYPGDEPASRGRLCLSCHLGTKNKFATHRIMAAGHPRLAFELDTFTELWRTAGRQPHYVVDADFLDRKGSIDHVDTWASGLLQESRQRLALIRDGRFAGDGMFPELGLYDCHACHRSMKTVQWRRLPRHGSAAPGMPFLSDGTFVMALALSRAIVPGQAENLEAALRDLHVAGSDSVDNVRVAATSLDEILARLQSQIGKSTLDNQELRILREILATGAEGNFLDYAAAEQAFMAVQMLVFEIGDPQMQEQLDVLGDSLENDERYRPAQFARLLAALAD
jgi:hypothetical protein